MRAPFDPQATGTVARAADHDATIVSTSRQLEGPTQRVATLVVVQGPEIGRHFPLRRKRVVIGRADDADVLVRHREVSRHHAAIDRVMAGADALYRLNDLGSTNGTLVNGKAADQTLLEDGDKVYLGEVVLRFELHDAIDARFHEEIRNRIEYDELTGLLTYESFRAALGWELVRYANSPKGCAVAMMDLDDFKKLNDTYGHLAGSFVLKEVGALITAKLRAFDVAARYGGEEFVAYLPETDAVEAMTANERLRRVLDEARFEHQGRSLHISISIGISHFPEDGHELERLVQVADERLYRAKREGKNRVICGG